MFDLVADAREPLLGVSSPVATISELSLGSAQLLLGRMQSQRQILRPLDEVGAIFLRQSCNPR